MNGKEIIKYLEEWAPKGIAWDRDNVGLQVGNPEIKIKNIMLSLDLSDNVIENAIEEQCNLIITHHPILLVVGDCHFHSRSAAAPAVD